MKKFNDPASAIKMHKALILRLTGRALLEEYKSSKNIADLAKAVRHIKVACRMNANAQLFNELAHCYLLLHSDADVNDVYLAVCHQYLKLSLSIEKNAAALLTMSEMFLLKEEYGLVREFQLMALETPDYDKEVFGDTIKDSFKHEAYSYEIVKLF